MRIKAFLLVTLLSVLCFSNIAFAQEDEGEEVILTTYYPAPYGNYNELTVSGNADSPSLDVTPTLTAEVDADILTAVHINPTFNDGVFSDVQHNGLIVEDGNVGIGTTSPDEKLTIGDGTNKRLHFSSSTNPSSPPAGSAVIYFDGTDLKVKNNAGTVITIADF